MLTKKCNKECYYCTTHSNDPVEVDMDYLKWVLDQLPSETGVELTGGEIGLIENIDEIYRVVRDHPSIQDIAVLSNGLMRQRGIDWLGEVEYWEHLIHEIKGREIIKFYSNLDLDQPHKYIIIATEGTTRSLLANWDYFWKLGLFRHNFDYKIMNHKSQTDISSYTPELDVLYRKLNNVYFKKMLLHFRMSSYMELQKELCQEWSPNPFIDFQTKQLGHCAMNVPMSNKVEFTKENLIRLMRGDFSENDYCQKCYSFDNGDNRSMTNNRSYEQ